MSIKTNSKFDENFWFNKIWGSWTGKIAGGTYGQLVEGKTQEKIQKMSPPLTGWIDRPLHFKKHRQLINDDEQFELIALMALESLSEKEFKVRMENNTLLSPDLLGYHWEINLHPIIVFTAEKCALINATKSKVPWEHAGDEIYNNRYQNPYFDWIGAQMKGEIFGMLAPAWGWHQEQNITSQGDLERLKKCLDLSYQDAQIAHRGIGIVGELFISAMVAIGIDYNPKNQKITIEYPKPSAVFRPHAKPPILMTSEQIITGTTAEIIIEDLKRLKNVLILYPKVKKTDVEDYFAYIEIIINYFKENHDLRCWEKPWKEIMRKSKEYQQYLMKETKERLNNHPNWKKEREKVLKKSFWVHTIPNNAAVALGLIYGDGDMFQTIQRSSEVGLDVDCNAGNASAILGAYIGNDLISSYHRRFIRDEILSPLKNWKELSIQQLAKRVLNQGKRLNRIENS